MTVGDGRWTRYIVLCLLSRPLAVPFRAFALRCEAWSMSHLSHPRAQADCRAWAPEQNNYIIWLYILDNYIHNSIYLYTQRITKCQWSSLVGAASMIARPSHLCQWLTLTPLAVKETLLRSDQLLDIAKFKTQQSPWHQPVLLDGNGLMGFMGMNSKFWDLLLLNDFEWFII